MTALSFAPLAPSAFVVGQQVVAMVSPGVPCRCNSTNHPEHPCRVTIVKVGRTKVHALMTGHDRPVAMTTGAAPDARGLVAVPVEEARGLYYSSLTLRGPRADAPDLVRNL